MENLAQRDTDRKATVGTIIHHARLHHERDEKEHRRLQKKELFKIVKSDAYATDVTGSEDWGPPLRSMADIAGQAPERQWAAGTKEDGWIPFNDVTLMYGPDGVGKTLLAGQLILAAARGDKMFGIPFRKMPALLIACEDSEDELHRRFEKQGRCKDDQAYFASFSGFGDTRLNRLNENSDDTPFYQYIERALRQMREGAKLLVIDNLFQVYRGGYIEPSEIATFMNHYLRRLAQRNNATVVLLAHPSQSQKNTGEGGYGGVGWSAGVRNRLYFDYLRNKKGHKISAIRVLSRKKANYATEHGDGEGKFVQWDDWTFRLSSQDDIDQIRLQVTDDAEAEAVFRFMYENEPRDYFSISPNLTNLPRKLLAQNIVCDLGDGAHPLSATRISHAVEHLMKLDLVVETRYRNAKSLRLHNPHNAELSYDLSGDEELDELCQEFLFQGRKPPRDPQSHSPSEPVQVRRTRGRRRRAKEPKTFKPMSSTRRVRKG